MIEVSDHTGFPEIMDGRVKTLQPSIHGGILARRTDAGHQKAMSDHRIAGIDLVVVNLYPFEATVAKEGVTLGEAIEQSPQTVTLKVPRAGVAEACRAVFAEHKVIDLSVEEIPVEEVIRRLFQEKADSSKK